MKAHARACAGSVNCNWVVVRGEKDDGNADDGDGGEREKEKEKWEIPTIKVCSFYLAGRYDSPLYLNNCYPSVYVEKMDGELKEEEEDWVERDEKESRRLWKEMLKTREMYKLEKRDGDGDGKEWWEGKNIPFVPVPGSRNGVWMEGEPGLGINPRAVMGAG